MHKKVLNKVKSTSKYFILVGCLSALALTSCSSKPSKESVEKAFKANVQTALDEDATKVEQDAVNKYAECMADKVYDKLSAKTLSSFTKAKTDEEFASVKATAEEEKVLDEAISTCASELISVNNK